MHHVQKYTYNIKSFNIFHLNGILGTPFRNLFYRHEENNFPANNTYNIYSQ